MEPNQKSINVGILTSKTFKSLTNDDHFFLQYITNF